MSSRCFPSYALRRRAKALGSLSAAGALLIAAAVAEGWAVSVPDHEGPEGMWGAPYEPGFRVLDGIRAALSSERFGLSPSAPIGLWGYSGGGLASAWAAEMCGDTRRNWTSSARYWAPLLATLATPSAGSTAASCPGLPAMVVAALAHTYPGLDKVIKEHTNAEGREVLERWKTMTTVAAVIRMAGKNMGDYLDEPLEDILSTPEVTARLREHQAGRRGTGAADLDRAGRARLPDRRQGHRRAGRRLFSGRRRRQLSPRRVQRAHAAAPAVGPDGAALAHRPVRRPTAERHLVRTTWPTMFNPMTYAGMARLAVIAAKVITGRKSPPPAMTPRRRAFGAADAPASTSATDRPDTRPDRRVRFRRDHRIYQ